MIRLFQFAPVWGLTSGSPFCLKVETYLRMAGLDYQVAQGNPMKAPKGKLPYIEEDGVIVADSGFILEHLRTRHGDPLDAGLDDRQRAVAHAVRRMLEESLYFAAVYARWVDDATWRVVRPAYFGKLPPVARTLVPLVARRMVRLSLRGQGCGRHSAAQVFELGTADLRALAVILGDGPYLLGAEPSSVDATVYGYLAQLLFVPLDDPLTRQAHALPGLVAYAERMRARYFPEEVS